MGCSEKRKGGREEVAVRLGKKKRREWSSAAGCWGRRERPEFAEKKLWKAVARSQRVLRLEVVGGCCAGWLEKKKEGEARTDCCYWARPEREKAGEKRGSTAGAGCSVRRGEREEGPLRLVGEEEVEGRRSCCFGRAGEEEEEGSAAGAGRRGRRRKKRASGDAAATWPKKKKTEEGGRAQKQEA